MAKFRIKQCSRFTAFGNLLRRMLRLHCLDQWFPKQDFRGSETRLYKVGVCIFLDVLFFKRTEICESLQVLLLERTLSSLVIRANTNNLSIQMV